MSALVPTRSYLVWVAGLTFAAAVMAFVPLFQLVGYESAAAVGVIAGIGSVFLTLHARDSGVVDGPLESDGGIDSFGRLLLVHWSHLLIPLAILGLNALRVTSCDPWGGLAFWGLIPPVSVLIGQTVGEALGDDDLDIDVLQLIRYGEQSADGGIDSRWPGRPPWVWRQPPVAWGCG